MRQAQRDSWQALFAFAALVAAVTLPINAEGPRIYILGLGTEAILILLMLFLTAVASVRPAASDIADLMLLFFVHVGGYFALTLLPAVADGAGWGFWGLVIALWLLAWRLVTGLSALEPSNRAYAMLLKIVVPLIFGIWLLFLWEVVVVGTGVPAVLLPPPSAIWARITTSTDILWADFNQTFLKAVIAGYAIGCASGFLVAIAADRSPFLKRGLLPVGNLVSALPIIGMAPIMVMWFGFDWQSKAAVVVIMTFFPMLVNTVAGLAASDAMQRDLMQTYAADYWQTLIKLRLQAALPFIFNALKINSTLALIGAIVAEFFGTPIVGMGFRISTEVGRLAVDMVWAEIAVAALAGSVFYGVLALLERIVTFWHPSFRT
ncbi:ABC transporter permease [Bauldia litoralis]|uniref:ABC transporter permease n=1 Tax=Bauldia litoralis TaxID=665467 RepID=UPI0032671DB5